MPTTRSYTPATGGTSHRRGGGDIQRRSHQVLGGYGYTRDYPVERLLRDAILLSIGGGTVEAMQKNIASDLAKIYR